MDRVSDRTVDVGGDIDYDQAGRAVTDQSSVEQAEGQAWTRSYNMDGDGIRLRNGFPRWVSPAGDGGLSDARCQRVAHRAQTPEDVSALGPEPQPEELL